MAATTVYLMASRVCHQRPERSFRVAGRHMPVCGRCAGLYMSGALGLVASLGWRRRGRDAAAAPGTAVLDRRAVLVAIAAAPTLATWLLEAGGAWDPGTAGRALAALPLGASVGVLVGRAFASPR